GRPRPVLDLRNLAAEVVADRKLVVNRDVDAVPLELRADAEATQGGQDRLEILAGDVVDRDLAAGDRREPDEARHLDVLGRDAMLAAAELGDALDPEDVRPNPLDVRAERDEEAAE